MSLRSNKLPKWAGIAVYRVLYCDESSVKMTFCTLPGITTNRRTPVDKSRSGTYTRLVIQPWLINRFWISVTKWFIPSTPTQCPMAWLANRLMGTQCGKASSPVTETCLIVKHGVSSGNFSRLFAIGTDKLTSGALASSCCCCACCCRVCCWNNVSVFSGRSREALASKGYNAITGIKWYK